MKQLYIIGAGGAAKEIYLLIKQTNAKKPVFRFKGFIDITDSKSIKIGEDEFPVYKESNFLKECNTRVSIVSGLGDTSNLKKIIRLYKKKSNFEFPNLIHPDVVLDKSVTLGEGNVITNQCVFTVDTVLASFNYINRGVHIGHDCNIGSYNIINPCAVISGGVIINDENLIGTNSTVLQYLKIGSNNKIGAGAVVINDVGNESCLIGGPAKNK